MDERDQALLNVVFSVIGFLSYDGIIDRDRLIQFLLEQRALSDPSTPQPTSVRLTDQHLETLIEMLERTQFPQTG